MRKPKLLLILPHMPAVRDLLFTGLLPKLQAHFTLEVVSPLAEHEAFQQFLAAQKMPHHALGVPHGPGRSRWWLAYLTTWVHWMGKRRITRKGNIHTLKTEFVRERHQKPLRYAFKWLWWKCMFHQPKAFKALLNWRNRFLNHEGAQEILDHAGADLILVFDLFPTMHQHLIQAATASKTPTVGLLRSWDNLSAKGVILYPFDHYLVWNEMMAKELQTYYEGIKPSSIGIVGGLVFDFHARLKAVTPLGQFPYQQETKGKKVISFMLNYPDLSPGYVEDVRTVLEAVESSPWREEIALVVRIQPGFRSKGQYEALQQFEGRLILDRRTQALPDIGIEGWQADQAHFVQLIRNSYLVINYPSTTSIDAAIFDVPSITIGYDGAGEQPYYNSVTRIVYRTHYQWVAQCKGNQIAFTATELTAAIHLYLKDPATDQAGRQEILRKLINHSPGQAAERIVKQLQSLIPFRPTTQHEATAQANLS